MSGFLNNISQFFGNGSGFVNKSFAGSAPTVISINKSLGDASGNTVVNITVNSSVGCIGATVCGVALTSFSIIDGTTVQGTTGSMTASATPGDVTVTNGIGTGTLVGVFEAFKPENISNVWFDLEADNGFSSTGTGGTDTSTWIDRVNGYTFVSPAGQWCTAGTIGGKAVVTAASNGVLAHYMTCDMSATLPSEAECYRIGINSDATFYHAPDNFGNGSTGFLAFVDGNIYDTFGTAVRKNTITGLTPDYRIPFASLYCYSRRVDSSGNWNSYLNGTNVITATGNTPSFVSSGQIGDITSNGGSTSCFAELAYRRVLTTSERSRVAAWILDKFGATA